jgi:hypothetical protein
VDGKAKIEEFEQRIKELEGVDETNVKLEERIEELE